MKSVGVARGAFCVSAARVCATITCSVAAYSAWEGWLGPISGMAKMEMGKQAMIAKAIMPKDIRIWLVVIFISHLQCCAWDGRCCIYESSPQNAMLQNCHIKKTGVKHR